jgi:hypothetical protein
MTKLIISLTTVPPRFPYVGENLRGLLRQNAEIDAINLYIPKQYKRFSYKEYELPILPEGVNLRIVPQDYGPATKVLPAVKEYKNQDVMILFCDDDKVYDPSWAQRFIQAAEERPGHAICEEGGFLKMPNYAANDWTSNRKPQAQFLNKNILYRVKRAVSLGTWKPSKGTSSGYVDILEGWGGVLVRPEFFDQLSFEIPELLWTVDDVWLSGCLERCAVPIWLNVKNKVRASSNSNEIKDAALRNFVYNGYGRVAANRACIKYFQEKYRIWGS